MRPRIALGLLLALAAACARASAGRDLWNDAVARRPPLAALGAAARIAPPGEPGIPLRIAGTIVAPDGETPAAGVLVYAYQTDASGVYGPRGGPRFRLTGWVRTDAQGRFRFDTIRPGAYPGRGVPAHVHLVAAGGGFPEQWLPELRFAGDPFLTARDVDEARALGAFTPIVAVAVEPDGTQRCAVRFRLRATSNF